MPPDTRQIIGQVLLYQSVIIDMMKVIDEFCRAHGIRYFLYGGTLLGAVRHHGFIPWDDDADICMLREDYECFIHLWNNEETGLDLECHLTDETSKVPFSKVRMPGTELHEDSDTSKQFCGIWIDIFQLDYYSNNRIIRSLEQKVTTLLYNCHEKRDLGAVSGIGEFVRYLQPDIQLYRLLSWLAGKPWIQVWLQRYRHRPQGYVADCSGCGRKKSCVPVSMFASVEYMEFEGLSLPVMGEWKRWLTHVYGDYMQMPPVEQRRPGHTIEPIDTPPPSSSFSEYRKTETGDG
ncbi:MAG: LicD family protein [Armatimonadota bacterium]